MKKSKLLELVFEVLAIFIGITVSFWIENNRINNLKVKNLNATLNSIRNNLSEDIELLQSDSISYIDVLSNMEEVMYSRTSNLDTLDKFFLNLQSTLWVDINRSGYTLLLEGEGYELLDQNLMDAITSHYEKNVKTYLDNTASAELDLMNEIRIFLFDKSPYSSIFPSKDELETKPIETLLNDPTFLRRLDALYLYRYTNQDNSNILLQQSRELYDLITLYLESIV